MNFITPFLFLVITSFLQLQASPQANEKREEFWMWGHHPDSFDVAASKGENYNFPKGRRIDMADACKFMGIEKCCVIRWRGLPAYPYDDYSKQFTNLNEIAWSIVDSGSESFSWKQNEALRLAKIHKNLTTFFLDDFFNGDWKKLSPSDLKEFKARAKKINPKSRLACVLYADTNGINPEFKPSLEVCDVVSFWFWNGKSLPTMKAKVEELRSLIGKEKKVLLGIYLWDFGGSKSLTRSETAFQLDTAGKLLDAGLVNGLIFHCTPLVDLKLESVDYAKEWLKQRRK